MHSLDSTSPEQVYDVCVVGAGPVGLGLALECEAAELSVLLLDAGKARPGRMIQSLAEAEISNPSRHVPLHIAMRSGFGGTSEIWGGRCVPFDEIDFESRPFMRHSGWPIAYEEMERWHVKAADYLDCGTGGFVSPMAEWDPAAEISCQLVERLSSQPRLGQRFAAKLRSAKLLSVRLGEVVQGLELGSKTGVVHTLRLASGFRPLARTFVLACGGLQVTRILLDLQRTAPRLFGGEDGPLGRFYMGHLTGKIASLVLKDPHAVESFDYGRDKEGYWYRRRFSLSATTQRKHELLNTVFWLGNPPFHDPSHRSAAASCLYLHLLPLAGIKSISRDFVSFHRGDRPSSLAAHLANIGRDPWDAAKGFFKAMKYQLSRDELRPFFIPNRSGVYSLNYHAEQIPHESNRVRFKQGSTGSERLSIDFRYSDDDALSVVRAHEILDDALRRAGKGYLKYWQPPEERVAHVLSQARDGYHQIGTVRMSENKKLGVVDGHCRVHELKNLYVAGSAVFPTSGQANPTFAAVALAVRLASRLREELRSRTMVVSPAQC
jgi:GMC oxidoreductase